MIKQVFERCAVEIGAGFFTKTIAKAIILANNYEENKSSLLLAVKNKEFVDERTKERIRKLKMSEK